MLALRLLVLLAAAAIAAGSIAADLVAQDTSVTAQLHPAIRTDPDALSGNFSSSSLGLKPPYPQAAPSIDLPFSLDYNTDTRSWLVPIDPKNNWGIGLNLDLSASRAVELAPPTTLLGLQPKRTPGLMLQKKF